ncbi:MAG TPA: hypothetical protein VKM55_04070 [Candidatus Lokiarchaeia archaeon]|nr:hypothetical protein [Candidatus Lokiarchaeia archaeon]
MSCVVVRVNALIVEGHLLELVHDNNLHLVNLLSDKQEAVVAHSNPDLELDHKEDLVSIDPAVELELIHERDLDSISQAVELELIHELDLVSIDLAADLELIHERDLDSINQADLERARKTEAVLINREKTHSRKQSSLLVMESIYCNLPIPLIDFEESR